MEERWRVWSNELLYFDGTQEECMKEVEYWYEKGFIDSGDLIYGGLDDTLAEELFHYFDKHSEQIE